jgi:hypothetical protein
MGGRRVRNRVLEVELALSGLYLIGADGAVISRVVIRNFKPPPFSDERLPIKDDFASSQLEGMRRRNMS